MRYLGGLNTSHVLKVFSIRVVLNCNPLKVVRGLLLQFRSHGEVSIVGTLPWIGWLVESRWSRLLIMRGYHNISNRIRVGNMTVRMRNLVGRSMMFRGSRHIWIKGVAIERVGDGALVLLFMVKVMRGFGNLRINVAVTQRIGEGVLVVLGKTGYVLSARVQVVDRAWMRNIGEPCPWCCQMLGTLCRNGVMLSRESR